MIILSTGSIYNFGIARVFSLGAEAGYDGMEVLIDGRWDTRDPAYISRLSSEYGLPVVALHSPFVPGIQGWPADQLGRLEQTVRLARELSVPLVVAHLPLRFYLLAIRSDLFVRPHILLPVPWPRRDPYYHFVREGRADEMESSTGVVVALENMPARHLMGIRLNLFWFNTPEALARLPHLTFDTTHWATWGRDIMEEYGRLRGHIVHVHLSNFDGREHRLPQHGDLRLSDLLNLLARSGYSGAVSVEISPDALEVEDEEKCREALVRTLTFCRDNFAVA
jgi:sugar phosphate isomerase/epimerase